MQLHGSAGTDQLRAIASQMANGRVQIDPASQVRGKVRRSDVAQQRAAAKRAKNARRINRR